VRGQPRHFTSSKVMCWVAADRGARLARIRAEWEVAARWQTAAEEIHADVCANAVDGRGVFTQHYGAAALDASMLLIPLFRFLPPDDRRVRATVLAIEDELTSDGLVLRYRVAETDDGFRGGEGTFTICSFWLVSALAEIGEFHRARQLCEKLLGLASPLLLYAEELDPQTGRHLGNFPQAFTHLALINAVMHIIRAEKYGVHGVLQYAAGRGFSAAEPTPSRGRDHDSRELPGERRQGFTGRNFARGKPTASAWAGQAPARTAAADLHNRCRDGRRRGHGWRCRPHRLLIRHQPPAPQRDGHQRESGAGSQEAGRHRQTGTEPSHHPDAPPASGASGSGPRQELSARHLQRILTSAGTRAPCQPLAGKPSAANCGQRCSRAGYSDGPQAPNEMSGQKGVICKKLMRLASLPGPVRRS
jgi:hypothetical protein